VALTAVTVRVDEFPAVIDVGFATMLTVGTVPVDADTVTVVAAFALPPVPVAVAV
jgi:hypothetical protein